ncbi:MAG: hypothetical protein JOZ02_23135 [Acidobacteria bacterium]|nr:hypothetical protein [Acidobacteriota bacterium]
MRLIKELAKVKATLARKTAQLVEQQQFNHRLRARVASGSLDWIYDRGAEL